MKKIAVKFASRAVIPDALIRSEGMSRGLDGKRIVLSGEYETSDGVACVISWHGTGFCGDANIRKRYETECRKLYNMTLDDVSAIWKRRSVSDVSYWSIIEMEKL